jgi:hypothetical protein
MFPKSLYANYLLKITALFWIITKIISYKLWLSSRLFPLIPVTDFFDDFPNWFHLSLYILGICSMFSVFLLPNNRLIIGCTIVLELLSCLLDQNRWQPYQYHFLIIFSLAFFLRNYKNFINYFVFLLVVIYANSGLHKLNGGFLYFVWENLILKQVLGFKSDQISNTFIHYSGLLLGLFEFFSALGLLFLKNKKIVASFLIAMHLFILVLLSPLGMKHNSVVLPWNFAMILFLLVLYFSKETTTFKFKELINSHQIVFFTLIGLLPLLNYFGLYDNYLSFNLYSGNLQKMYICIENRVKATQFEPYFSKSKTVVDCPNVISVSNWSLKELNTFPYPEKRVYYKIMHKWKAQNPTISAKFYLVNYPYLKKDCVEIDE